MATEKEILAEKSINCRCRLCAKKFDSAVRLRMHMFSHSSDLLLKCIYCQQNFKHTRHMVTHMETIHHMTFEDVVDYLEKLNVKQKEDVENELDKDNLKYSCNICGKKYSSRKDLIQHMRQMHPQKERYFCGICQKGFARPWPLKLHLNSHTNIRYDCKLCRRSFRQKRSLKHHMLSHTINGIPVTSHKDEDAAEGNKLGHARNENFDEKAEKKEYFECDVCHKGFADSSSLEKHLILNNSRYDCKLCNKSFHYKQYLQSHLKLRHTSIIHDDTIYKNGETKLGIAHDNVKEETCSEQVGTKFEEDHLDVFPTKVKDLHSCFHCNKTFHHKMLLDRHIRWHFGFKLYTCQICRKTFSNARYLKRHTPIHLGDSVYTCNKCGELFPFHKVLKEHMIYEHGDKSVTCKFCRKLFTEEALNEHMKIHRTEDNRCKICGVSFQRPDHLERHMAVHSDRRPHKCDLCSKTFKSYHSLRKHKASHRNIFKQCDICGKSIASNGLYQHMKSHTDLKTFQCEVCSKFFKMKHQLKSHLLTHYDFRKHECELCGFKFKWAHHLRSHWKVAHKT